MNMKLKDFQYQYKKFNKNIKGKEGCNGVINALKEIDQSTLYLKMNPFEKVIRRFYVCSDEIYTTQITVIASIDGPQKHAYDVKVRLGYSYSNINSFINSRFKFV